MMANEVFARLNFSILFKKSGGADRADRRQDPHQSARQSAVHPFDNFFPFPASLGRKEEVLDVPSRKPGNPE
jgi:hypothetical protein